MQKKSITIGVFILLLISILPNITSNEIYQNKDNDENIHAESGHRLFGIIIMTYNNSTSEGLSDYNYRGYLQNVDATFSGYMYFSILHFMFMDRTFSLKINGTLHLVIDYCYALFAHDPYGDGFTPNTSGFAGFAFNIRWEVV